MRSLVPLFLVLSVLPLFPQQREIDSIVKRIGEAKSRDEAAYEKAVLSMRLYMYGEVKGSLDLLDEALTDAGRTASPRTMGALHNTQGTIHFYEARADSAIWHYEKARQYRRQAGDSVGLIKTTSNIGNIYLSLGKLEPAQRYYEEAMRMESSLGLPEGTYTSINNMAMIYGNLRMKKLAIRYYRKAISRGLLKQDPDMLSLSYEGISKVFRDMESYDSSLYYARKSLELCREMRHPGGQAYALNSMASTYQALRRLDEALAAMKQALPLALAAGDKRLELATYGNIAAVYVLKGQLDSAMRYMEIFSPMNQQLRQPLMQPDIAKLEAEYLVRKKDFEKAYQSMKWYAMLMDSVHQTEMYARGAELQQKYENEKKEKENQLLQSENQRFRSTRNLLLVILGLALLLIVLGIIAFRRIRRAKRTITKQKALVEEKQKEILDSITYARRIQYALLASGQLLKKNLPQHFVLFRPKAVVSGDFYWASKTAEGFIVVTGDCTGHGVPGAFMSLLNITKLSQVINEQQITRTDEIFNRVREEIVKALNPEEDAAEETKDGMDAVICKFRTDGRVLEYTAANNAFYIVRARQLLTCKADKMPVGKGHDDTPFTLNEVALEPGDMVYTFTDGFADQFGGPLGKKFKYKNFEQLLVSISAEEPEKQRQLLEDAFDKWRGSLEQVDDVCVIGVRV